jgi:hypothetical protein
LSVLGVLVAVLVGVSTRAQAPAQADKASSRSQELIVYPLKNAPALEVARALREVVGGERGLTGRELRVTADTNTNSVLIQMAPGERGQIEKAIKALDVEGSSDTKQVVVHPLTNLVPDTDLERALQLVFEGRQGKFALDRQRRVVVVSGDRQTRDEAIQIVKTLDVVQAEQQKGGEFRVRVVWLVSGLKRQDAAAVPADLSEVTTELAKLGIDKLQRAAQVLVTTPLAVPFQVSGSVLLDAPCRFSIEGTLTEKSSVPSLEMEVNAMRAGDGPRTNPGAGNSQPRSTSICSLHTHVSTPVGHAVVMGVTPTDGMTSVFVIQVLRSEERRPGR